MWSNDGALLCDPIDDKADEGAGSHARGGGGKSKFYSEKGQLAWYVKATARAPESQLTANPILNMEFQFNTLMAVATRDAVQMCKDLVCS